MVLVSDGSETCSADLCAVGAELERLGVNFTAHVVGFDVTARKHRHRKRFYLNATTPFQLNSEYTVALIDPGTEERIDWKIWFGSDPVSVPPPFFGRVGTCEIRVQKGNIPPAAVFPVEFTQTLQFTWAGRHYGSAGGQLPVSVTGHTYQ